MAFAAKSQNQKQSVKPGQAGRVKTANGNENL